MIKCPAVALSPDTDYRNLDHDTHPDWRGCPVQSWPGCAGSSSGLTRLDFVLEIRLLFDFSSPVLPLNHRMTRVSCPPGPASGHSPGLCHWSRGQARSAPCSASLTWQVPSPLCHSLSRYLSVSQMFRVPDVHNWLSLSDWRLVTTALCPQLTGQ